MAGYEEKYDIIVKLSTPKSIWGDYAALIDRHTSFEPYIVAEGINENDGHISWAHGHYFGADELTEAVGYLVTRICGWVPLNERSISYDRMSEIATRFKDELDNELTYTDHTLYEVATSSEYDIWMTEEELKYFEIYPTIEDDETEIDDSGIEWDLDLDEDEEDEFDLSDLLFND